MFYAKQNDGKIIEAQVSSDDEKITVTVNKDKVDKNAALITVFGDELEKNINEPGFFLCGSDFSKYSSFLTYFTERDDFELTRSRTIVGAFGISGENISYLGIPKGMKYDCKWKIVKSGNKYSFNIVYDLEAIDLYEDIVIELYKLPPMASYIDMAKRYRRYMIEENGCIPIKERVKKQKELDYLKDSVEIRIRMAWKPAPAEIMEQTEENEPDIHVACTFDDVSSFADELKKAGVEKAQICLVGWNKSGHDGRWPTAFPVEPLLGGEERLRALISHVKDLGYRITCHTNSTDCYSISDMFDGGRIRLKNKKMEPVADKCIWSGGRMYHLCPKCAWEIAQDQLPKISGLGFVGAHYIDVMSIIPIRSCFDPSHPCNAEETVECYEKIAGLAKNLFGAFSSEGSFDHSAKYLDFGLYTKFNRKQYVGMDEGVNFFEIAFHGIVMSNAGSVTVNYPIKPKDAALMMTELNYRPAFYVYSKFKSDGKSWMGSDDLVIDTPKDIKNTVAIIKSAYDEYKENSYLQCEFIENYKSLDDGICEVEYSDGTVILVNYTDMDCQTDRGVIPSMSSIVLKKREKSEKKV